MINVVLGTAIINLYHVEGDHFDHFLSVLVEPVPAPWPPHQIENFMYFYMIGMIDYIGVELQDAAKYSILSVWIIQDKVSRLSVRGPVTAT